MYQGARRAGSCCAQAVPGSCSAQAVLVLVLHFVFGFLVAILARVGWRFSRVLTMSNEGFGNFPQDPSLASKNMGGACGELF